MSYYRRLAVVAGGLGAVLFSLDALYGPKSAAAEFGLAFGGGMCLAIAFFSLLKAKREIPS